MCSSPKKPSGTLKTTAKGTGTVTVHATSIEAAPRHTSPRAPSDVIRPLSGTPIDTTVGAQVEKVVPPGERRNKTTVYCLR
jgi:hypothetical protein